MQDPASQSTSLLALALVAARHGVELDAGTLRRTFVIAEVEPSSGTLVSIAEEVGLDAKSIRPKWSDLPRLQRVLPAILIVKDSGALVLEAVLTDTPSGQVVILRDPAGPAEAQVALDEDRLAAIWSGEIILAKKRHILTDENQPFSLRWVAGQVLREKALFGEVALASVFSTFLALVPIFAVMIIVDRVMVNHSASTLSAIMLVIALAILFDMVLSFLRRVFMEATATRIDGRLNLYVMEKLLTLPMEYFERHPTGSILSKVAQIGKIRGFLTGQLFTTFLDLTMLIVLLPVMLFISWQLSLVIFVLAGIIFIIIYVFLKPLARLFSKVVAAEVEKNIYLTETVYGMRTIKTLAIEGRRRKEWDVRVAIAAFARHALATLANYPPTLTLPFEKLMYVGPFLIGAYISLYSPNAIAPGALMAFTMLGGRIGGPLVQFARLLTDYGEVGAAVSEVASVLNQPPENTRIGSGLRLPIHGDITFSGVDFRYSSEAPLALDGADFHVAPGTIFGIMGRSGSGKSTITRLIQGLNASYRGVIKIDGMDLREIDLHHLRTSIGVVAQENFLFTGTVRENIGIARPDASFADIVRAAQLAGAEEFIERLPRGYDTVLQEGASNLSGGQRQRLAIARALVVDPAVLILDEATSALDAESEAIINANLMRIAQGRTIICVSHRLAMLVPADAILVMEKGRVYDIGRHEELLHRCDIYKHMWYTQNRHSNPAGAPSNAPITLAHSSAG
jgi:subfamily B ATP-binding cassette protein HlyB/CyaB